MNAGTWSDTLRLYADWPLRLAFAAVFLFHGIDKIVGGVDGFANMMDLSIGLAWAVAITEIAAGSLVLAGGFNGRAAPLLTRLGGALAVPIMIGAIQKVHWPRFSFTPTDGFPMGGMEFQLLLLGVGVFFLVTAAHFDGHRVQVAEAA